jgi:indole-3-glycerol phosphate synthase
VSPATTGVLERILTETREELERRKRERPLPGAPSDTSREAIDRTGGPPGRTGRSAEGPRFRDALAADGIGVIAEFKRRSPSAGALSECPDVSETVRAYERGGAVAVSVLTEGPNFAGTLDDLVVVRAACGLPLLRKDFIVDPYQLHEAVAAGADAVLLIVAALSSAELASLQDAARALGLDALVEVHDREELNAALEVGAEIIGVNNRDLRDFSVELGRTEAMMDDVPSGVIVVSESGIADAEQVRRLYDRGVSAVLVGESLMRSPDPAAAVRALTAWTS